MKVKTSISIDKQIWAELKNLALKQGKDVSFILKEAIENELYLNLDKSLMKYPNMANLNWILSRLNQRRRYLT
jgi:hypothetical protein